MGYHATLHADFERDEQGIRHGLDGLVTAYCSSFTPRRQQRAYGVDFLDLLVYFHPDAEGAQLGDPEIKNATDGDARGVWTPDWEHSRTALDKLEQAAREAEDAKTLEYLPKWRTLVELGSTTPGAVVSWSF
jgi:hypothetical protein